jgi:hypothetical protein
MHVYLLIPVTIQGRPTEKGKGQNFAVLSLTDAMKRFNVSTETIKNAREEKKGKFSVRLA